MLNMPPFVHKHWFREPTSRVLTVMNHTAGFDACYGLFVVTDFRLCTFTLLNGIYVQFVRYVWTFVEMADMYLALWGANRNATRAVSRYKDKFPFEDYLIGKYGQKLKSGQRQNGRSNQSDRCPAGCTKFWTHVSAVPCDGQNSGYESVPVLTSRDALYGNLTYGSIVSEIEEMPLH